MRFVDLKRVGEQLYRLDIRTKERSYRASLLSEPGARQGRRTFEEDDVAKKCAGFTRTIDFANDVVTTQIARTCLGNRAWVRVQILNTLRLRDGGPLYIDNPHNHRAGGGPTQRLYSS